LGGVERRPGAQGGHRRGQSQNAGHGTISSPRDSAWLIQAVDTTIAITGIIGIGPGIALGDIVDTVPLFNLSALLYAAAGVVTLSYLRGVVSPPAATGDQETSG
jgi:hypothetical protein